PTAITTGLGAPATSRRVASSASIITSDCSPATPARPGSPRARARPSSAPGSRPRRPSRSCSTWPRAAAPARPRGSPACTATRSHGWHGWPANTPGMPTRNSGPFPPETREVQFDEKGSFVAKEQHHCDPDDPADDHKGDWWDHVVYEAEHRLALAVVPGARS